MIRWDSNGPPTLRVHIDLGSWDETSLLTDTYMLPPSNKLLGVFETARTHI
jgi:hypothetical protein